MIGDPVGALDLEPEGVWGSQAVESSPACRPRYWPGPDGSADADSDRYETHQTCGPARHVLHIGGRFGIRHNDVALD